MDVSAVGSTTNTAVSSQIESLRKQVTRLTKDLSALATSAEDAKTKETKAQLLTQQITMLEARIAALQNQQARQQLTSATIDPASSRTSGKDAAAKGAAGNAASGNAASTRPADGAGWTVDVQL